MNIDYTDVLRMAATQNSGLEPEVVKQQHYKTSPTDDFPAGTYFIERTGDIIKYYHRTHERPFEIQDIETFLEKEGFVKIHISTQTSNFNISRMFVWEKEVNNNLFLICTDYFIVEKKKERTSRMNYYLPFDPGSDANSRTNLTIISNCTEKEYSDFLNEISKLQKPEEHKANEIQLVVRGSHGYDTMSFDLPKQELDLETNYGKDFIKIHDKIIKQLDSPKGKGLVLLHGKPGTGKTFYLKYLASLIKEKNVLFVPPYLADMITSPEMMPFLVELQDSILFIEDAERVITDREEQNSVGVSNILNLTDGILSDILNIQIVATFNMAIDKIDPALLRKGRLIAEHEFGELSVKESNNLIKKLGIKGEKATEPMTLTQIYNMLEPEYKSEQKQKQAIGFGS
jgi:hypothetical protein